MIQLTEEELKDLIFEITHNVMGIDAECLENKATPTELADKLYQYRQDKLSELLQRFNTSDSNCIIPVVSESFTNVCRILLSKDVKIEHDLDGFKKFVVNGEMCHSTKMVYKKIIS